MPALHLTTFLDKFGLEMSVRWVSRNKCQGCLFLKRESVMYGIGSSTLKGKGKFWVSNFDLVSLAWTCDEVKKIGFLLLFLSFSNYGFHDCLTTRG